MSSGLIGLSDWQNGYRYHVFALRTNREAKDVPLSIQFEARNNSAVAADLRAFVFHEKSVKLDMTTGQLI
jgi:hypothetical protein